MEDTDDCLDLARCFPLVRAEYQPSCVGATIRAKGAGALRLELKSADGSVLWWATQTLPWATTGRSCTSPGTRRSLRKVKSLHWTAEPWSAGALGLSQSEHPDARTAVRRGALLALLRQAGPALLSGAGMVRERAPRPAGQRDSIAATGLFCLATAVACRVGLVKQAQAEQILHKVHATVSEIQRANGLLPATVSRQGGKYTVHEGSVVQHPGYQPLLPQHAACGSAAVGRQDARRLDQGAQGDRLRPPARCRGVRAGGARGRRADAAPASPGATGVERRLLVLLLEQMSTWGIRSPKLERGGQGEGRRRSERRDSAACSTWTSPPRRSTRSPASTGCGRAAPTCRSR